MEKYYVHRVKGERNILHTVKRREDNWISHIVCGNCLLKHVIEGTIEETFVGSLLTGNSADFPPALCGSA
jgi:hypothetical protein